MIDTHCHLNFKAFDSQLDDVVKRAVKSGVTEFIIPSTDIVTSQKAVEISSKYNQCYAAVGIHPHHVFELNMTHDPLDTTQGNLQQIRTAERLKVDLEEIRKLLMNLKVVAIGEVGVDRYYYKRTKYSDYQITKEFIHVQKQICADQIELAKQYKKSLILHNREAVGDFLDVVTAVWSDTLSSRTVFHCCEPDEKLLRFAIEHNIFIGIDGDVTYKPEKQRFVKKIPSELLVVETDAPFLIPEPYKSQKIFPNEPSYLKHIVDFIAELRSESVEQLSEITTVNARKLFSLDSF